MEGIKAQESDFSNCPICGAHELSWTKVMDGWCLEEEVLECPNGCYKYHFAYGTTEIEFSIRKHVITFGGWYGDPQEEIKARNDAIYLVIEAAKQAREEDDRN